MCNTTTKWWRLIIYSFFMFYFLSFTALIPSHVLFIFIFFIFYFSKNSWKTNLSPRQEVGEALSWSM